MNISGSWMDPSGGWMELSGGWMNISGSWMDLSGGWMGVRGPLRKSALKGREEYSEGRRPGTARHPFPRGLKGRDGAWARVRIAPLQGGRTQKRWAAISRALPFALFFSALWA